MPTEKRKPHTMSRTITADDRLRFIALCTMAAEHTREARKYEVAIQKITGGEDGDHVSDEIYGSYNPDTSIENLDAILAKMGCIVDG